MHDQDLHQPYTVPSPGARLVAIAAKWAKRTRDADQFDLFSDLSRFGESQTQILINDAALAIARRAAEENFKCEDEGVAQEAREILEWVESIEELRRAGAAPNWLPPEGMMTLEEWVNKDDAG